MKRFNCRSVNSWRATFNRLRWLSSDQKPVDMQNRREEMMRRGLPKQKPIDGVKDIVLVSSGKGGVGKSTTSVNLATALKLLHPDKGVGLLDADIFGPTVPLMMNLDSTPLLTNENLMEPLTNYGVKCMSMGFLIEKGSPVIWRGLMVMQALQKLMRQVYWEDIDYLIVDTPPGTGDTHLSLIQNLPIAGVVVVTTPHSAALQVTQRSATMYRKLNIPLIGIVENMNYVKCGTCSSDIKLFGDGTAELAKELNCDVLGSVPLNLEISECCDEGVPIALRHGTSEVARVYMNVAESVVAFLKR